MTKLANLNVKVEEEVNSLMEVSGGSRTQGSGDFKHQRSPVVHSRCYSCQRKVVSTRGDYTHCQVCGREDGDPIVKEIRTLSFCEVCLNDESMRQALFSSLCEVPHAVNTCYFDSYTDGVLKIYACQRQDGCWNKIRRSKPLTVLRTPPEKRPQKPKKDENGDDISDDMPSPTVASPKAAGTPKSPKKPKAKRVKNASATIFPGNMTDRDLIVGTLETSMPNSEGNSPIPSYSYESEGTLYTPYTPNNNKNAMDGLGYYSPAEPVGPPAELFNLWPESTNIESVSLVPGESGAEVLEPLESPWM